jgi:hypothetical protein
MSLCFVSNKDLTVPYSDIARRLKEQGEQIVWLAPSRRWAEWLRADGWPAEDVLCLADHAHERAGITLDQAMAELEDIEGEAPATISNIIRMCRNLNRSPAEFSYSYLALVRRHVEPFLRGRGVEVVFGEGTWGFELLTWLLCRHQGIPMLTASPTRIPGERFFFVDAVTAEMFAVTQADDSHRQSAMSFLSAWLKRPAQPSYMRAHRGGYTPFRLRWINEAKIALFRPELDRGDATLWPLNARIADRTERLINSLGIKVFDPFERGPANERYVLYPLHHQPESSVDVYGSLNSNQTALIETVSRLLPASHRLWVKEHKGAIGDRPVSWYRRIRSLPNVRIIDPFEDIFPLMRQADLVITITGTAAYEAALLGIPCFGLAPVFFAPLLTNRPGSRSHPLEWRLRELLSEPRRADHAAPDARAVEFIANIYANSYEGDPAQVEQPPSRRLEPDYLTRETEAFSDFVAGLRRLRREHE